uniref:Putative group i salivary lipocalin n=1 Tax=Rhipicephalus pulchellus TaxID=72859 RepID=L7LSU0_RHIPC
MGKKVLVAICFVFVVHMKLHLRLLPEIHASSFSIKDFVNTRECIWTYNTTKVSEARCRYDLMRSIHGTFITFNRTVLHHGQRISTDLLGRFSRRRKERLTMSTETLFYKAPDSSCAVIVFRSLLQNGSWHGDLRVRNSAIRRDPFPECQMRFSQLARSGRVIYGPRCSEELHEALI